MSSNGTRTAQEAEVLAVHDTFWESFARRDLDARFAVCAPDITFFGTGQHERAAGIAQYRAMNEVGVQQYPHAFTISYRWKEVRLLGDVAWVEGDSDWLTEDDGVPHKQFLRTTVVLKRNDDRWWVAHVHGSDPDYRLKEGEHMTSVVARNKELEQEVAERTRQLLAEKKRSDDLLLNILPEEVANELKRNGSARTKEFAHATILFTDFKDFTTLAQRLTGSELVAELNACFEAFDRIITGRGIEKIKTIGDAYMCVGGLPDPTSSTPADVVLAALEMQDFMKVRKAERIAAGHIAFDMRVGMHTGAVVAGIVGVKKFQYDIWGDTVNVAARMESSSDIGQVNISESTYALVKDHPDLVFRSRGRIQAKGKGELEMYFAEHR